MTNSSLENAMLGEISNNFDLETSEQNKAVILTMLKQAKNSVDIMSYDIEPKIYNDVEVMDALRDLVTANQRATVRVLIHDSKSLVLHGHHIIELSRRLSSYISIRKLSSDYHSQSMAYFVVDRTGFVYRQEALRYEGIANFSDRGRCRDLLLEFDKAWEHASPDPELQRLHL